MNSLRSETIKGVRWTTLNAVGTTALQFVQLAILGRLLGPNAFGLMAMVMVVTELAMVFEDFGLSSAVIQRKIVKRHEMSSLYWINIILGFIIYTVICLVSPLVADGFGSKEIKNLLPVAAIHFLIVPFGVQFQTLLRKTMRFDMLTKLNLVSLVLSLLLSVVLAWHGYGVWSLVWGSLSRAFFRTTLLVNWGYRSEWRPRFRFQWSDARGYLSFGLYRLGAMVANQFNSRVDQLIIGATMGPLALGYYNMAFRLVMQPIQRLSPILISVAFPVFSIVQDDTLRLKRGFLKIISSLSATNAPVLIGLAAIAPLGVPFLIGGKWMPSVPLVQIMAFYALARSLSSAQASLIIAKGKANWTFYWNVMLLFVIPPVVYLASMEGKIIHVALALAGLQTLMGLVMFGVFIEHLIGSCFREYLFAFGRPVLLAGTMGLIVFGSSFLISHIAAPMNFFLLVATGMLIYAILSWFFQREVLMEFYNMLPSSLRSFGL